MSFWGLYVRSTQETDDEFWMDKASWVVPHPLVGFLPFSFGVVVQDGPLLQLHLSLLCLLTKTLGLSLLFAEVEKVLGRRVGKSEHRAPLPAISGSFPDGNRTTRPRELLTKSPGVRKQMHAGLVNCCNHFPK